MRTCAYFGLGLQIFAFPRVTMGCKLEVVEIECIDDCNSKDKVQYNTGAIRRVELVMVEEWGERDKPLKGEKEWLGFDNS